MCIPAWYTQPIATLLLSYSYNFADAFKTYMLTFASASSFSGLLFAHCFVLRGKSDKRYL